MYLEEILNIIEYKKIYNKLNPVIENFEETPEDIELNGLMFGVKRKKEDTNYSWKRAFSKGASCAIISIDNITKEDEIYLIKNNKTIVIVDDVRKSLAQLAKYKRDNINKIIIGITGSAGKTSTKDILHRVLSTEKKVAKSLRNKNSLVGLPITLLNTNDEEIVVLEMGMCSSQTIKKLTMMAKPNVAILTNVGTVHLANFNSIDEILEAKMSIVEGLDKNGIVILNIDNEYLNKWYLENKNKYNIITYSINNKSNYQAEIIESDHEKSIFKLNNDTYILNVAGECQVYNSIPAIILSEKYNIKSSSIKEALSNIELSCNRMEITEKNDIKYIDDSYNANLDAMKEACLVLNKHTGRKIACLGSMLDCGNMENFVHIQLGKYLTKLNIDIVITVGNVTNHINNELKKTGYLDNVNCFNVNSNKEASDIINKIKKSGDTILVKASGSMEFHEIVKQITEN